MAAPPEFLETVYSDFNPKPAGFRAKSGRFLTFGIFGSEMWLTGGFVAGDKAPVLRVAWQLGIGQSGWEQLRRVNGCD
jgi:hypothetical protein